MKNYFKTLRLAFIAGLSSLALWSCEQDDNPVGAAILENTAAQTKTLAVALSATNIAPDGVRADRSRIIMSTENGNKNSGADNAVVGVYEEPIFGKTNANFYTQIRLSKLAPSFGKNATVDSIVLSLPSVSFKNDTLRKSDKIIETLYTTEKENPCKVIRTTHLHEKNFVMRIDSVYGNKNAKINLQVHAVSEHMGSIREELYSNESFTTGMLLGEKNISDLAEIRQIQSVVKEGDDPEKVTIISTEEAPSYHIQLPGLKQIFQDKVINTNAFTGDQITFINNVLKGIKISTNSENGFLFTFKPGGAKLTMYYSFDNPKFTDNNSNNVDDSEESCATPTIKKRSTAQYNFLLGNSISPEVAQYNVFLNQITNTGANLSSHSTDLYLSGMGGNHVTIDLDKAQIESLKNNVKNKHWAITEASLFIYPNKELQGNLPIPRYLHVYNNTQKSLIPDYLGKQTNTAQGLLFHTISQPFNGDYYKLSITEFIKNIVEKEAPIEQLALLVGNYGFNTRELFYTPFAYDTSDNLYNPYRVVVFGANAESNKKLSLEIKYTVK